MTGLATVEERVVRGEDLPLAHGAVLQEAGGHVVLVIAASAVTISLRGEPESPSLLLDEVLRKDRRRRLFPL